MSVKWVAPNPGNLLWCRYPEATAGTLIPGPKPRPVLVVKVWDEDTPLRVQVAYGTSQKVASLYPGEFAVLPADNVLAEAGLIYPTKFDLSRLLTLPYEAPWFEAAPARPDPVMGQIPAALKPRMTKAWLARRAV